MSIWSAVGAAAGYYFGGPAGAMVGANIGGGIDRNNAAANSAQQAQDFSAQQYASRYQTQVKDMEAAGLNPMLAYMQAPGNAPQGVTYQPTNPFERTASDYSSAYNVHRVGENIEADTEQKSSQIRLNEAQTEQVNKVTEKIGQEINNLQTDNDRVKALIDNLREEKQNLMKTGWNLTEQGNVLRATVSKLLEEVPWLRTDAALKEMNMQLIDIERQLRGLDLESAKKFDNLGRDVAQARPLLEMAIEVFKASRPRGGGITINK
jgi:uncharacterized phage infection (PIP) family protein YhgE